MNTIKVISVILAVVIAVIAVALAAKTDILKVGRPGGAGKQYSFSKFQLFLWTLVICPLFVIHWGFHYTPTGFEYINETSLILLGISVGTTVASGGIDVSQLSAQLKGVKSLSVTNLKAAGQPSGGFWADILSGNNEEPSVNRLQNLLFTFVYIIIYVTLFIDNGMQYPVFDDRAYYLMGISSGGFLVGKGVSG